MYRSTLTSLFRLKNVFKSPNYKYNIVNSKNINRKLISLCQQNYSSKTSKKHKDFYCKDNKLNLIRNYNNKYKKFRDEDAAVIFDINEEKEKINLVDLNIGKEENDPYAGINFNRGMYGVFDIEDLIDILVKDKNTRQIFVAQVPNQLNYVDYIVIVTGKSPKHMNALALYVRKIYKAKRHKYDLIPIIEGKGTDDWIALDLGNIALHIFSHETRLKYDLETLWSVGSQYDALSKVQSSNDVMEKFKDFLKIFQPAE